MYIVLLYTCVCTYKIIGLYAYTTLTPKIKGKGMDISHIAHSSVVLLMCSIEMAFTKVKS